MDKKLIEQSIKIDLLNEKIVKLTNYNKDTNLQIKENIKKMDKIINFVNNMNLILQDLYDDSDLKWRQLHPPSKNYDYD